MKNGTLVDDLLLICETHISVKLRGAKVGRERKLDREVRKDENKQENKGGGVAVWSQNHGKTHLNQD